MKMNYKNKNEKNEKNERPKQSKPQPARGLIKAKKKALSTDDINWLKRNVNGDTDGKI